MSISRPVGKGHSKNFSVAHVHLQRGHSVQKACSSRPTQQKACSSRPTQQNACSSRLVGKGQQQKECSSITSNTAKDMQLESDTAKAGRVARVQLERGHSKKRVAHCASDTAKGV